MKIPYFYFLFNLAYMIQIEIVFLIEKLRYEGSKYLNQQILLFLLSFLKHSGNWKNVKYLNKLPLCSQFILILVEVKFLLRLLFLNSVWIFYWKKDSRKYCEPADLTAAREQIFKSAIKYWLTLIDYITHRLILITLKWVQEQAQPKQAQNLKQATMSLQHQNQRRHPAVNLPKSLKEERY